MHENEKKLTLWQILRCSYSGKLNLTHLLKQRNQSSYIASGN